MTVLKSNRNLNNSDFYNCSDKRDSGIGSIKFIETLSYKFTFNLLRLTGYFISKLVWFVRYEGRENIPPETSGPFLICSNHQTYIDPVWITLPFGRRFSYMAIEKSFDWPVIGRLIRYLGAFPVSSERHIAGRALKESIRSLRDGSVLIMFPEGARTLSDGSMMPFKTGAVRIALDAGVPILPVTISGGNKIWPRNQKYPTLFKPVTVRFHPVLFVNRNKRYGLRENLDYWTNRLETIVGSGL